MSAVIRGRTTAPTAISSRWRGPIPDPSIKRRLPSTNGEAEDGTPNPNGCARVPLSLLHGGFQDLAVLVWVQLRLWFQDAEGRTSYYELARALGVDSPSQSAVKARFSVALQPLLGTWIERRRVTENEFAYRAVMHKPRERYAMIRQQDLALLLTSKRSRLPAKPADIADFARWQLECGQRGWTADPTATIAERWRVTPPTIRASRKRLESLGLLKVIVRDHRLSEVTWLQELYDPTAAIVELTQAHRAEAGVQPWRVGDNRRINRTELVLRPSASLSGPTLDELRHLRASRRHQALVDLTASERTVRAQRALRSDPHEVYLIHFPGESCFKVGLTKLASQRVDYFSRRGGVVVDRVSVENRSLAEIIEVDVLTLVEDWHLLGDPHRRGSGYTEMWSDRGPTVDLAQVKLRTTELVSRLRCLLGQVAS